VAYERVNPTYFINKPLHVSSRLAAHYQEDQHITVYRFVTTSQSTTHVLPYDLSLHHTAVTTPNLALLFSYHVKYVCST
jgi:hypothetical protein